jgi:hypothetical protein
MKKSAPERKSQETYYRQYLMEKRRDFLSGLGTKFDTIACMGRVAEEDQAQVSHDEFVSLHLNSLDYTQLRLVEPGLCTQSAFRALARSADAGRG